MGPKKPKKGPGSGGVAGLDIIKNHHQGDAKLLERKINRMSYKGKPRQPLQPQVRSELLTNPRKMAQEHPSKTLVLDSAPKKSDVYLKKQYMANLNTREKIKVKEIELKESLKSAKTEPGAAA